MRERHQLLSPKNGEAQRQQYGKSNDGEIEQFECLSRTRQPLLSKEVFAFNELASSSPILIHQFFAAELKLYIARPSACVGRGDRLISPASPRLKRLDGLFVASGLFRTVSNKQTKFFLHYWCQPVPFVIGRKKLLVTGEHVRPQTGFFVDR